MNVLKPLTVLLILTTLVACNNAITPQGNTPAYALELVEESFNRRGLYLLDGLLSDDFVFYFDPNDVGTPVGDYEIPESWDREDFTTTCENMFLEADLLEINFNTTDVSDPEEGTTYILKDVPMTLLVMVTPAGGYYAEGLCDFGFANDTFGGYDNWVVSERLDFTASSYFVNASNKPVERSLGYIIAIYYG
ncbi:MAG: hypothetical protein JSW52_07755 [Candidatus Coatesbacteria bacterium]|nr:MAG: hypothetical protein JSW52_07755 [Candidatus Coatesbacteria bacterium]